MRGIYNFNAIVSDAERYIEENGRFLYVDGIRAPHKHLYAFFGIDKRTYFLWLKKGVFNFEGVMQYDFGKHCRVFDLRRLVEKIKAYQRSNA